MKEQIYQNGFYLMLGIIIASLIALSIPKGQTTKIETIHDTITVKDTVKIAKNIPLNDSTLKVELKKNNIQHHQIVLAQAKLETGNYTSKITKTHNNIFGIRYKNGYKKYNSWQDCVIDYKKCIQSRYKGGCYYAFLKRINYAEDPNYINKLKSIV